MFLKAEFTFLGTYPKWTWLHYMDQGCKATVILLFNTDYPSQEFRLRAGRKRRVPEQAGAAEPAWTKPVRRPVRKRCPSCSTSWARWAHQEPGKRMRKLVWKRWTYADSWASTLTGRWRFNPSAAQFRLFCRTTLLRARLPFSTCSAQIDKTGCDRHG